MPFAHQGGWDEILLVTLPFLLYGGYRLWERVAGRDEDEEG